MFKNRFVPMVALSTLLLGASACQQSEIDQKTAAEVSETAASATNATATAAGTGVVSSVIKEKSRIDWVGAKVTRDHDGKFNRFDGTIEYIDGKPSNISFEIDTMSIESDTPQLTEHLKSPDFFDVAKFPKATFTSTSLTEAPAGSPAGATHILRGNLEMHGVSKEVSFPVKAEVTPEGVRTTSEFTINRTDWGINYKGVADDLIKNEVLIKLDLLFPPPPATV